MNVYISTYSGSYGGGLILVAANSAKEALEAAATKAKNDYLFHGWDCDLGSDVIQLSDELTPFTLIEGLDYASEEPAVVAESIYIE